MLRVGIDISGDNALVARVSNDLGRPVVDRLDELAVDEIAGKNWLNSCHPVFGVNDSLVQVKSLNLKLTPEINFRVAGKFELTNSLLEPQENFIFSTYETGLKDNFVGTICRLEELTKLVDRVGLAPKDGFRSDNFVARSAALGSGYATFCQNEPGELIGLIDLGRHSAAISLTYKGRPISLAHMSLADQSIEDETGLKRIAVQAKTMINFQKSRLSGGGLNLPLATLILSGERANRSACDIFSSQFPSGVKLPVINPAFLIDSLSDREDVSRFLVAMGLAFNSL